jgi:murein DD-endopeptidase MepM/ murein hydrolase activator NlpD
MKIIQTTLAVAAIGSFGAAGYAVKALSGSNTSLSMEQSALSAENAQLRQQLEEIASRIAEVETAFITQAAKPTAIDKVSGELAGTALSAAQLNAADNPALAIVSARLPKLNLPSFEKSASQSFAGIIDRLNRLNSTAVWLASNLDDLAGAVEQRAAILASLPLLKPAEGRISSRFGERVSPTQGKEMLHKGMDIAGGVGAEIFAPADGTIRYSGNFGGFGRYISIEHGNGFVTKFAHMKDLHVKKGQRVQRGDLIGSIGNSGRTTGPHLHYEVWYQNQPVDPERFLAAKGALENDAETSY